MLPEATALIALYRATGGARWQNNTGWDLDPSGGSICHYHGISCNITDNAVLGVSLFSNSLAGTLPSELGLLSGLESMYLGKNQLFGTVPTQLGIGSLKKMFLGINSLQGSLPSELGAATGLELLDVRVNGLYGRLPSQLGRLTSMIYMSFHSNYFEGRLPQQLGRIGPQASCVFTTIQLESYTSAGERFVDTNRFACPLPEPPLPCLARFPGLTCSYPDQPRAPPAPPTPPPQPPHLPHPPSEPPLPPLPPSPPSLPPLVTAPPTTSNPPLPARFQQAARVCVSVAVPQG